MALKHKVPAVSVLAGLLLWVAAVVVDVLFFHDEPFLDMLILAVPPHDIYIRSIGFTIVLALGFILSAQLANRDRVEQEVRKSRAFLQTVIDAIPDATMAIAADYQVVLANRAARDIAGVEDPVASGLRCHQVFHHCDIPCDGVEYPCPLVHVVATKGPALMTHTHHDAEGNEVFVEITAAPVFDDASEVTQIIESYRDITEQKKAEEEIANLAKFPAENPNPVLRVSGDGTIMFANNAAQPLLDAWSCRLGQAIPKQWAERVSHVLVTGQREDVEIECDGRTFLVTFAPVLEAGYVNLYAHDTTKRGLTGGMPT